MLSLRLAWLAHASLALYLATLLAVPRVQSALAGLTALLTAGAALAGYLERRGYLEPAGLPDPAPRCTSGRMCRDGPLAGMAIFLVPAAAWGLLVLVQVVIGMAPLKLGNQVIVTAFIVVIGLSDVPARVPDARRLLLPAAALGAIGAGGLAIWQSAVGQVLRPHGWLGASEIGTGAIKFGDLAAVLALLSLVLVLSARGWRYGLGIAGGAGGMIALGLSQTRGGLLGVLVALGALAVGLALARWKRREALVQRSARTAVVLALAFAAIGATTVSMQHRFAEIEPQLQRFQNGDYSISATGQRLALWQAAWRSGLAAPLTGVGLGGFERDLERQYASGEIPGELRILYRDPHNQYLYGFALAGVPGLVLMLAMFWGPVLVLTARVARGRDSPEVRAALVVAASFAGFALTDSMFDRQITIIAFFLLVAWLSRMAAGSRRHDPPP